MTDEDELDDDDLSREVVKCGKHGPQSPPAFACVHLVRENGIGVHYPGNSDEPYPDLVCDACNDEGPWTDEQAVARIKLICPRCWETCFERNTRVPPHADAEEWIDEARERAAERQDAWTEKFGIGKHGHYQYSVDDDAAWIGFGANADALAVRADALVIGSWSEKSNTWLWGWANSHWPSSVTWPIVAVKRYGEAHGIERLWRASFVGDEDESWAVAATALDLLPQVEGMYRVPGEGVSLFLAVLSTRVIQ